MEQLINWLGMGGYSMYVWPAYALVLGVLLLNFLGIKRQKARTWQKLHLWFKRQQG